VRWSLKKGNRRTKMKESIENRKGSAVGIVMDPADDEGDEELDVNDFLV
jgi:hypothetical protein